MKCPGQDMQFWESDAIFDINCPECGKPVEFYKDDTTRKCGSCGHRFVNPKMDFGCAAYCQFAEQCLGTLPEDFIGSRDNLLKDKVAVEIKRFYKTDFKKIGQISRLARYAEKIGKEEGVNMAILLCAAYLKDLEEDKAIETLEKLGAKEQMITQVCSLIRSFESPPQGLSDEGNVLTDALHIVAVEDKNKTDQLRDSDISFPFATAGGKMTAEEIFRQLGIAA